MSGWRSEKVSTIREEFDEINDSMKGSSSRMKNKVGAQKGAFIKMKQKKYVYLSKDISSLLCSYYRTTSIKTLQKTLL